MMRLLLLVLFSTALLNTQAQSSVKGVLKDSNSEPVPYAHVGLYNPTDSSLVKVETTNDAGAFQFVNIAAGLYFFKATFMGMSDLYLNGVQVSATGEKELGTLQFVSQTNDLEEFTVSADRAMVEVMPDRTIFNVQGTINSTGTDAITLLRKAPAVTVDNQNNISVLGRAGVKVFIDGKQLPLEGDDLSAYLKNLPADQIDRFEIITSPGAKYEAEGNAGIIDIRLKKDKSIGANGSLSGTYTQGELTRYNINASGNYRNKKMNIFGNFGYNQNDNFHNITSESYQNGLLLDEINNTQNNRNIYNYRFGTDFYLKKNHTLGFLVSGTEVAGEEISLNQIEISDQNTITTIDSVLIAENDGVQDKSQNAFNVNYRYAGEKGQSLNLDLDYGLYQNQRNRFQPNRYYESVDRDTLFSENINSFDTPTDIEIYTAKLDYEMNLKKGKLGFGGKFSQVETENTFEVSDVLNGENIIDSARSNSFDYSETVYAGYASYSTPLGKEVNLVVGLRAEQTISTGDLTAFLSSLDEPAVEQNYLSWFPNAGITWQMKPMQSLSLNYGRRINRPDYNVLNPFRNQLSEISIEKGNPYLKPEIVNNIELGYTLMYKYNFKIGYSETSNQITRLIGPDDVDPRAGFISWDNLATQSVFSASASLPITVAKWWNAYFNLSLSHIDNQADYGDGAIVDIQVVSYTIYQSQTFTLPKGFKAEVSGYYSGPGVWGGVFEYEANWSLDVGLQKKLFKEKLKARVSAGNIFNQLGWQGESNFNGLRSVGYGMWDSRNVSLSLSYNFGNQSLKSKKRKTGIEDESGRVN
jgi:iron complex outermembrane receptor protein